MKRSTKRASEGRLASKPKRRKPPFWRRDKPHRQHDIVTLRPKTLPKRERFETKEDAALESERSEALLRSYSGYSRRLADTLRDCREGDLTCDQPYCPLCARQFRRFFTGELLRLTGAATQPVHILTVLLEQADHDKIESLDSMAWRQSLRKRLDRSGLNSASVIGGFEMAYKQGAWILHANLLIIGGNEAALNKFAQMCRGTDIYRPIVRAPLADHRKQLSYLLKFTTYQRPHEQQGGNKGPAVPLNAREHHALVDWMSERRFKDYLFFYNAEQRGPSIRLRRRLN
jgi:hypothetical protein